MDFIKRMGSFAASSWKDFSDYCDQKTSEAEDVECKEDDFVPRKPAGGFFRKRFSKKKLLTLSDPRSPTTAFERTPIQLICDSPALEMLNKVQQAVDTTPTKPLMMNEETEYPDSKIMEPEPVPFTEFNYDWDLVVHKDKALTDSLIVEVSALDLNSDSTISDKKEESVETSIKEVTTSEAQNCKIVGFTSKSTENLINEVENEHNLSTSTPIKIVKKLAEPSKPRTPLVCIKNQSPMVKQNHSNPKANPSFEKSKNNKLNLNRARKPKAPLTPMRLNFNSNRSNQVAHFDKENF